MGVLRVLGVIPAASRRFILSKSVAFLLSDLLFAAVLILVNLGPAALGGVYVAAQPHMVILSVIMGLLGFLFSLICRDFKQFTIAFAFILILMTAPVFMAGNFMLEWPWIDCYPVYHLFMALKNAFWGTWTTSALYYLLSAGFIALRPLEAPPRAGKG